MGDGEPLLTLTELAQIIRGVDPGAFVVAGRIVRRAIRFDRELSSATVRVPHWWSFTLTSSQALQVIDRAELGIEPTEALPERIILIAAPDPEDFTDRPRAEILRDTWRALLHARVHLAMEIRIDAGMLESVDLRDRIRRLGPVFEEARSVLYQEDYLLPPKDDLAIYVEFAATYLELREFAPGLIASYFPAVDNRRAVDTILAEDVDVPTLMVATRLPGACRPSTGDCPSDEDEVEVPATDLAPEPSLMPSGANYRQLLAKADEAVGKNNLVRAAMLRINATRLAGPSQAGQARSLARKAIDQLAGRLRTALGADDAERFQWSQTLIELVPPASRGFWTPEARLLYDLQKVCLDHEKPYYAVDLVEWIMAFGKRPLRRLLADHSEVLIVLHLRGAARHLAGARLPDQARGRLVRLLKDAVHRAEVRLRDRFRPVIAATLAETGFAARNVPERVAVDKLTEELLDRVVARGFLAIGDLRDAISRNNRKLPDVASPAEFLKGDRLLQADRMLANRLDGVYRRGEIYLRMLQRVSSLAFGTRTGRFLTRYLVLPYGGTAVILEGLQHIVGPISRLLGAHHEVHILSKASLAAGGTLALLLIASTNFRTEFGRRLRQSYRLSRDLIVGIPTWLLRSPLVRRLLASRALAFACRALVLPSLLSYLVWLLHPRTEAFAPAVGLSLLVFMTTSLFLTTRAGRDLEELAFDSVGRLWTWIFASLIPGLFRLVMEFFDRILEAIERVLYTVDEWLRFRGGQNEAIFWAKAVLGVVWFFVTYVVRFVVTLLVEPQVNPIKHFPVVTVSHKIMLTQVKPVIAVLSAFLGNEWGVAIATPILFLTPGIFGFLVWELKENWRLYEANRPLTLRPVVVGHHGETLARLLKPGFHSGTVPKLFGKLRRAERKAIRTGRRKAVRKHRAHLHEVEESIRHFVDRDFRELLVQGRAMAEIPLSLGEINLSAKRITVEVCRLDHPGPAVRLAFEEHSGWIVAGIADVGWLPELDKAARHAFASALAGLYKMAGVGLVREAIAFVFEAKGAVEDSSTVEYDFRDDGIVVWLDPLDPVEILYLLRPEPGTPPLVTIGHPKIQPPEIDPHRLVFADVSILWTRWVEVWENDLRGADHPAQLIEGTPMLPHLQHPPTHPDRLEVSQPELPR